MILYINTADAAHISLALIEKGVLVHEKTVQASFQQEELLLTTIQDILQKTGDDITSISSIAVVDGPGGFSSLRIGVTVANALAFALAIPIQAIAIDVDPAMVDEKKAKPVTDQFVVPAYGSEPHISMPKKF